MPIKRYVSHPFCLLLLLPLIFASPVYDSSSEEYSDESRFFHPFFGNRYNKSDDAFDSNRRPFFSFGFNKGGRGRDRDSEEDENDMLELEGDDLSEEERFFSFFSNSRYNTTGRPFHSRPRPSFFGFKGKGRDRDREEDDERDLLDIEEDDLSDDARIFFFSSSRYNSTGRPLFSHSRPSFSFFDFKKPMRDGEERGRSSSSRKGQSNNSQQFSSQSSGNSNFKGNNPQSSSQSSGNSNFNGNNPQSSSQSSGNSKFNESNSQFSSQSSGNSNSNGNPQFAFPNLEVLEPQPNSNPGPFQGASNSNSPGFNIPILQLLDSQADSNTAPFPGADNNNSPGFNLPTLQVLGSKRSVNEAEITKRELPCPAVPSCTNWVDNRYRSPDGVCNNIANPLWGAVGIPFRRYLRPVYDDGVQAPRGDLLNNLPTPREVSVAISNAGNPGSLEAVSLMVMQFGQFVDHDLALTPEFEDDHCCEEGIAGQSSESECRELNVTGDPFYDSIGVECLHFTRSEFAVGSCVSGQAREQVNTLTSYVDASQVYGSTQRQQNELRLFFGGQLRVGVSEEQFSGSCRSICPFSFLPTTINHEGEEEFFAGDSRAQEQPGLTSIHTLFVRFHNHIASLLQSSRRSEESTFQEARRIVTAIYQHITYNEFLPLILGSVPTGQFGLSPLSNGYTNYNENLDASTVNVFATAAFRFGHSLIKNAFTLNSVPVPLAESFGNLHLTMGRGRYPSDFLNAICSETADGMDYFMVETLTNRLFAEAPTFRNGSDLMARNIMRAREHGIPPYIQWRALCGLPVPSTFDDLLDYMPREAVDAFRAVYNSVEDIDLFPAGIAEGPFVQNDGLLGPTFACLIGNYFRALKFGDRYFYETSEQPDRFSSTQLRAIRRIRLSTLICAYTNTPQIRPWVMLLNVQGNNFQSCANILREAFSDLRDILF